MEYHPEKNAEKEAEGYFEYLKNKNKSSLNALFSKNIQNSHDLDAEWEEFFNAIDGNIVSFDKVSYSGEDVHVDKRKVTYSSVVITYKNVKTDTGKTYDNITYSQTRVNNDNNDDVGINVLAIKMPSDNKKGYEEKVIGGL